MAVIHLVCLSSFLHRPEWLLHVHSVSCPPLLVKTSCFTNSKNVEFMYTSSFSISTPHLPHLLQEACHIHRPHPTLENICIFINGLSGEYSRPDCVNIFLQFLLLGVSSSFSCFFALLHAGIMWPSSNCICVTST